MVFSSLIKYNPNILPDKNHPNNYCDSCEKSYADRDTYRQHLRGVHKMLCSSKRRRKQKEVDLKLSPDIDDPNLYCRVCKTTFILRCIYRQHIRLTHKIKFPTEIHPPKYDANIKVDPTDPKSTSCDTCKLQEV
jgi:hypothetical protein